MTASPTEPVQPPAPAATTTDFEDVLSRPAIHERDRVPGWIMRAQGQALNVISYDHRHRLAVVLVLVAVLIAVLLSGTRIFRVVFESLDVMAFGGLFLVNWIGNGGILVPIPGTRLLGLLMIFQHAVILPSWEVFAVSGAAMALGLVSYYVAGARSADAYARGDKEGAQQVVADTTILATADQDVQSLVVPSPDQISDAGSMGSEDDAHASRRKRLMRRFSDSWGRAQAKARPTIEQHGLSGMFVLCLVPSPAATAAAFLGGAMRFGFARFLLADFASKYVLAGIVVVAGLFLGDQASSLDLPF